MGIKQAPTAEKIKSVLERELSERIRFAYLLGSAGTDRFHAESDIDIGVYWDKEPDMSKLTHIKLRLENLFGRDVDLVSLNSTDVIFARQVLETGRELIVNDPGELLSWKVDQMSRYPDFKYSRKVVEENILNRKKYV